MISELKKLECGNRSISRKPHLNESLVKEKNVTLTDVVKPMNDNRRMLSIIDFGEDIVDLKNYVFPSFVK